jgi:hypothetical protein
MLAHNSLLAEDLRLTCWFSLRQLGPMLRPQIIPG